MVDRKKDMIKTGGENVASREVEEVIFAHAAVAEVAVFGIAHLRAPRHRPRVDKLGHVVEGPDEHRH